jgi:hypothetical protein
MWKTWAKRAFLAVGFAYLGVALWAIVQWAIAMRKSYTPLPYWAISVFSSVILWLAVVLAARVVRRLLSYLGGNGTRAGAGSPGDHQKSLP